LGRCLDDLRDLARDIYPAVLAERGLDSALNDLARRAAGVVDLDVVEGRFPEAVELAVYFVVDAALRFVDAGNEVSISVSAGGGELVLDVGGAGVDGEQFARLRDRVEGLDGSIEGGEAEVRATFPVG